MKISKKRLQAAVTEHKTEMQEVITTIIESVTAKGQRKKLIQNPAVMALLERYDVHIEE